MESKHYLVSTVRPPCLLACRGLGKYGYECPGFRKSVTCLAVTKISDISLEIATL